MKFSRNPLTLSLNSRTIITGLLLAVLFCVFLALVQFATPNLAGTDDYFHIRFARVMRDEGLTPAFPGCPDHS